MIEATNSTVESGTAPHTAPHTAHRSSQVHEHGALGRIRYLDMVRAVYSEGGMAAFYRGLGAEFAKVLPGMAIAFTSYETMKRFTGAT